MLANNRHCIRITGWILRVKELKMSTTDRKEKRKQVGY